MNVVTENVRMKATLVHAVQPVHEAQDLRPPSPLPWGLCQLSKNHMWGDARSELHELMEKGNLSGNQPAIPFNPGCKFQEHCQWVPQASQPYDTVGLTTASNRRLIMGNDLSQ